MDLIAISYQNIGPFKDQLLTVRFRQGKYLIKAPIGSGKSFLFFDGPVFALYKYAGRPMLHRLAKEGFVHLLFEEAGSYWLIERVLKPTKSGGESVQSRLYRYLPKSVDQLDPSVEFGDGEVISSGVDIKVLIADRLEEISTSNQREVDAYLTDLLPPKEVALSIHFLMQEAENVFELQPAQRVQVFKHLFGLIGIDEAKERLSAKRKELQTTIKVKGDTDQASTKLRTVLRTLTETVSSMQTVSPLPASLTEVMQQITTQPFFADVKLLQENIQIEQFSVDDVDHGLLDMLQGEIIQQKTQAASLQGKIDQLTHTLATGQNDISSLRQEIDRYQYEYASVTQQLASLDVGQIADLKKQTKDLQNAQQKLLDEADFSAFDLLGQKPTDFSSALSIMEQVIAEGKALQVSIEKIDLQLAQIDKDYQKSLTDQQKLEEQLAALSKDYSAETEFYCEKIQGDCPYVELIKGKGLQALKRQKQQLETQIDELKKITKDEAQIKIFEEEKKQYSDRLELLRKSFAQIDRKQIEKNAQEYQELQKKSSQLVDQLHQYEHLLEQQTASRERQTVLQATITTKEEYLNQLTSKHDASEELLDEYRKQFVSLHLDGVMQIERGVSTLQTALDQISHLITTHKENQLLIRKLEEQEQMAKELYTIFSKELMVVALQDFLPILEQVINANLAQMVDYEIRFSVPESTEEKMELEITIVDQHGAREVKSLSGGQKAIVKIAWILAVSVLMKSKFLLLDETITSMDVFTVAKVADLLQDFVKSQQMKFYVVTHSTQIQEMEIWDKTVEVTAQSHSTPILFS